MLTAEKIVPLINTNKPSNIIELIKKSFKNLLENQLEKFWNSETIRKRLQRMPLEQITECNKRRKKYWENNRTLPCYACKYYNRSLRILMTNLFDMDVENVTANEKKEIKPIHLLRVIVKGGSAKSLRQNYMIQLAEVLDCLGNTMLSCASLNDGEITSEFLAKFLHDTHEINTKLDSNKEEKDFMLLSCPMDIKAYNKVETCLLYYWEASICFRYGKDMKKAAGSMKKILRVIQNYLRVEESAKGSDRTNTPEDRNRIKVRIGEFLNEIKNRIVKQSLLCLYSHYNYINAVEIQRLKWIFSVQMYENISLNRLTLFPDVEEIMLIYYELIKMCIVEEGDDKSKNVVKNELEDTRMHIEAFARTELRKISYSWNSIEERNENFNVRLVNIYKNLALGALRHDYTMYERILSLHTKTMINRHILEQTFTGLKNLGGEKTKGSKEYFEVFKDMLDEKKTDKITDVWKLYFPHDKNNEDNVAERFRTLEFLILDSIYCLTEILDTISPHMTTTLFTHSFIGTIYHSLNQWNYLFDSLFRFYKFFDEREQIAYGRESNTESEILFNQYDVESYLDRPKCNKTCSRYAGLDGFEVDKETAVMDWRSKCPYYNKECAKKGNRYDYDKAELRRSYNGDAYRNTSEKLHAIWHCRSLSDRLFNSLIGLIGKPNIQYTFTNYSGEMALVSYRSAIQLHREGREYKDMISRMYYIDDELKNDTVQFDLALERFKINSDYIDNRIRDLMGSLTESLYDIENFCMDKETKSSLSGRFVDLFPNVSTEE